MVNKILIGIVIGIVLTLFAVVFLPKMGIVGRIVGVVNPPSSTLQMPQISIKNVDMRVSVKDTRIDLILDVYNPNSEDITFDRASYEIYLDNKKIGEGNIQNYTSVPAKSHISLPSSAQVSQESSADYINKKITGLFKEVKNVFLIKGNGYFNLPIVGSTVVSFIYSK